jgi:hypothetical protein
MHFSLKLITQLPIFPKLNESLHSKQIRLCFTVFACDDVSVEI